MRCKFEDNGYNESDKIPNADKDKELKFSGTTDRVQFGTAALEVFPPLYFQIFLPRTSMLPSLTKNSSKTDL